MANTAVNNIFEQLEQKMVKIINKGYSSLWLELNKLISDLQQNETVQKSLKKEIKNQNENIKSRIWEELGLAKKQLHDVKSEVNMIKSEQIDYDLPEKKLNSSLIQDFLDANKVCNITFNIYNFY